MRETVIIFVTPFGLTHPEHVARYNVLSSKLGFATRYYNEDLLT